MNILSLVLTAIFAVASYGLYGSGVLDEPAAFVALNVLLLGFLTVEVARVRRLHPQRWLMNPVVWASFFTFVMAYGASNFVFFLPEEHIYHLGLVPVVTPPMIKHMALALVAALAMWAGYWSPIAATFATEKKATRFQARFLPRMGVPYPYALIVIVAISSGARVMQLQLGVFGYSSNYDRLVEAGGYTQYLSLLASAGKGALILAALRYYSNRSSRGTSFWMYSVIALELFWGLMSGFKGQMVMPLILVMAVQYLVTGSIDRRWPIAFAVALSFAYAIIEPYRIQRHDDTQYSGTSFGEIISTMSRGQSEAQTDNDGAPLLVTILARGNLTWIGSFGVEFSDSGQVDADAPAFLKDIFLAPLYAWTPRVIWESKPLGNLGLWYNQVVMGNPFISSTGMGPVTYLYFAGGGVAVFLGFFFVGCVQRVLFFLLQPWRTIPGALVFMGMLGTIGNIDSSFGGFVVMLFRDLPIYLAAMFLVFPSGPLRRSRSFGQSDSGLRTKH